MNIFFQTARNCINPTVPLSLAGYFNRRMWEKILDDLEVRALVMQDEKGHYGAILHFDMLFVTYDLMHSIWEEVKKRDLPHLNITNTIMCATHTHTAPEIRRGREGMSEEFFSSLVKTATDTLEEALKSPLHKGELFEGITSDSRFIFNRRYWMKDGKVLTNPGKGNPDIVRPEGEIDPEIPFFLIREEGKNAVLVSSIVNHSDTIGGTGVSADWPGFYRREMESFLGQDSLCIPLVGTEGNINHFDNSTPVCQACYEEAERLGKGYAQSMKKALEKAVRVKGDGIKTINGDCFCKTREIDEEELAEAKATMEKWPEIDVNDPESVKDLTSLDLARGTPFALKYFAWQFIRLADYKEEQRFSLTGIALGDSLQIASLPSEPFVEIGLQVRKGVFSGKTCLIAALAGTGSSRCSGGYIPNSWNYGRGGYETTPRSNPYAMNCGTLLVEKWRELAKKLDE